MFIAETGFVCNSVTVPVQLIVNAWAEEMERVPGSFTHGAKVTSIE